jgi:hypothetical protein
MPYERQKLSANWCGCRFVLVFGICFLSTITISFMTVGILKGLVVTTLACGVSLAVFRLYSMAYSRHLFAKYADGLAAIELRFACCPGCGSNDAVNVKELSTPLPCPRCGHSPTTITRTGGTGQPE